jgi:hypothetical protein
MKGHSALAKQQTGREHYNEKASVNCIDGVADWLSFPRSVLTRRFQSELGA